MFRSSVVEITLCTYGKTFFSMSVKLLCHRLQYYTFQLSLHSSLNGDIVFDDVAVNPLTRKGFPIDE